MNLGILERIKLYNILPTEGNFLTLKTIRGLQNKLTLTEDEITETGMRLEDDQYKWDKELSCTIDFSLSEKETITNNLKLLDEQGKATMDLLDLYEKFSGEL